MEGESKSLCGKSICVDETNIEVTMILRGSNIVVWERVMLDQILDMLVGI